MHDIRWIDLDGVDNMRDVGGLPTLDGSSIATGRLLRSDNLQQLSEHGRRQLVEVLGVTDVIDLRSHVEVAREGRGPFAEHPAVRTTHLSLYADDAPPAASTEQPEAGAAAMELPWVVQDRRAVERGGLRFGDPRIDRERHWSEHYLRYLAERPSAVVEALRIVGRAPGAVVVHCAAGKDRTGAIVALALSVAGADPAAIVADFVATTQRLDRVLARLRTRPSYAATLLGQTIDQQRPRAGAMRGVLAHLEQEHGGVQGWLQRHGWSDADTSTLWRKLRG